MAGLRAGPNSKLDCCSPCCTMRLFPMSDDLCFFSATKLIDRIRRKEVSPVEVTRAVLSRAERLQPELNCFITLCGDEAVVQAQEAEKAVLAGRRLGLLH